ncbi:Fido domain containing protein [Naviculisporaceae sp. PSN 640]
MDESAYDYSILGSDIDIDDLYQELLQSISQVSKPGYAQAKDAILDARIRKFFTRMIHSSNFIERAGYDELSRTEELCNGVFDLLSLPTTWTGNEKPHKQNDLGKGSPNCQGENERADKEVTHHVKAALYLFDQLITKQAPLTNDLILQTHGILTHEIDIPPSPSSSNQNETPWNEYSGKYRQDAVSAGLHSFPPAQDVPILMRRFISSFNHDLKKALEQGSIDPIALAAKYCHVFVNIHPFLDGNGRMCRLILNALLLKYGGGKIPVVAFGGTEEERDEYLSIAASASMREGMREDDEEEEEDEDEEGVCYHGLKRKEFRELASYVLKYAVQGLREGWNNEVLEVET